ncbi:aldehyde dehydrogenase [Devosia sp. Root436]|uniref:aldehyde dehydrogenase family protein n=1 Tax=Devosia sp. Root436 TaxID=1736537 RepID=UPI00070024E1|nr:aldehyde dehydrogenase family protein [Devosia sp. Root436]KQX38117.1 aldehyde dehydrogenase [Devosia sp. Root436]
MYDFDPNLIATTSGHFIDGKVVGAGADRMQVIRPSDSEPYADIPLGSAEDVDRAVTSAHRAYRTAAWARIAPRDRAKVMYRWADLIEANKEELARLEAVGSTRPISEAIGWDVPFTAEAIRFFAEFADKLGGDVAATRPDHLGLIIAEPYGVIAAIAPWNVPLVTVSWKVGPALAAGNAVVLKPSEMTPFSVMRMAELAIEAGMPPGIFNIVQGNGPVTGDALCRHPMVGKITFTGSGRSGAAVMTASAESGAKPVTLELGGKSPQLVFGDAADLDKVAQSIARSMLGNAGQICVTGTRLIVQRSIEAELIDRVGTIAKAIRPGATWKGDTTFSPIISARQLDQIDAKVRSAFDAGAEAAIGGHRIQHIQDGNFYEPTILVNVKSDMPAVREEIFGPVVTVQHFDDEEEGIAMADDSIYGLAAGIYTADLGRAMRAMRALETGTVWINRYGRTRDFILPTGGYKQSGFGKDLGRQAVEANMRLKTVLMEFAE